MKFLITFILLFSFYSVSFGQYNNANDYIEKAEAYLIQEDYEEALRTLSLGINEMPDSVILYDMKGTLLESLRFYDEAIDEYSTGIEKADN